MLSTTSADPPRVILTKENLFSTNLYKPITAQETSFLYLYQVLEDNFHDFLNCSVFTLSKFLHWLRDFNFSRFMTNHILGFWFFWISEIESECKKLGWIKKEKIREYQKHQIRNKVENEVKNFIDFWLTMKLIFYYHCSEEMKY